MGILAKHRQLEITISLKWRKAAKAGLDRSADRSAALARTYGLRVDDHVDERTDPIKASRAAARHVADLMAEFGDDAALIAIATYTMGPDKMRAMLHNLALEKGGWRRGGRGRTR